MVATHVLRRVGIMKLCRDTDNDAEEKRTYTYATKNVFMVWL